MEKIEWKPGTMVYPLPAVLVSCGATETDYNLITIAWTGTICTNPPMCYISVQPRRHSHALLMKYKEFVINLTTKELAYATDWCGVKSGRDVNKFEAMKLSPIPGKVVKAPLIKEAPISIECKVTQVLPLGSHDMFVAEVVAVNADPAYYDETTGVFDLAKAQPICYSHGKYYELGKLIGKFGYSVEKPKTKRKAAKKNAQKKSN